MKKVILVLVDGLNYETAQHRMPVLLHMTEHGKAKLHKEIAELPTMSRPLYETVLTGQAPCEHGVLTNDIERLSRCPNLFSHVKAQGGCTTAAAYYWVSELYVRAPFRYDEDRFHDDPDGNLMHGIFYWEDEYPDSHLYADANGLIQKYHPDFALVHPMGVDNAGHDSGCDSARYRNAVQDSDQGLARFLPKWLDAGYTVVVTADHGINPDHGHGGNLPCEREVPLFVLGAEENWPETFSQLEVANRVLELMELPPLSRG